MTTIISWMLTHPDRQSRLVLADDILIEMAHEWDHAWRIESAVVHLSVRGAHQMAVQRTAELEDGGFTLSGGVIAAPTDIASGSLYAESAPHGYIGPLLQQVFRLEWEELS